MRHIRCARAIRANAAARAMLFAIPRPISVILLEGAGGVKGSLCNGWFLQDGEQDSKLSWSKVGGGPVIYFRSYWKINHNNSYRLDIWGKGRQKCYAAHGLEE